MTVELLLVPVDDTVVFPDMTISLPLEVDVEVGDRVLLVPRDEDGVYANVGVIADVTEVGRLPRGGAPPSSPVAIAASPESPGPAPTVACMSRSRRTPTRTRPAHAPRRPSASTAPSSRRSSRSAASTRA